jgi:hypothetical protein
MKFSFSILLVAAAAITFTSCSKDNVAEPIVPVLPAASIQTYFKFDGNLTDSTDNITTAATTGTITYGNDRNGNANKALYLDGASKIVFPSLSVKGKSMTMSAWIKYGTPGAGLQVMLTAFTGAGAGPALVQVSNKLGLSVSTPSTNTAVGNDVDAGWHHLASTYDGVDIKVYVDGVLSATVNHPGSMDDSKRDMIVGFFSGSYWKGYIDELRVYNTVLTAGDIQKLIAL